MALHFWSKFHVSKFIFEGEDLFWPFLHLKLGYEKMTKSQIEGCLRREGGVGGQILDFGYLCAQFYCPLCDGSKNLQFWLVFILETLHWRVIGSILLRFWTNFEPMSQRKHQFTAAYSFLSACNLLTYWKLVRNYTKLLVSTCRGSKWSRFVSICLNLSLQYHSFSWIASQYPSFQAPRVRKWQSLSDRSKFEM